jgi:hippurate hydrolase
LKDEGGGIEMGHPPDVHHLLQKADEIKHKLIAIRRDIHRYPELSMEESRTAAKVADELTGMGLEVSRGIGGHSLIADLQGHSSGPTIALRADMDALPIQENTGLPFSSEHPGKMHACGHDMHTAILLGAAQILVRMKDQLHGTVRFLFQGAEETLQGAKAIIKSNVLDGVSEIYGLHNVPVLPTGKIATRAGAEMASSDQFEIVIEGKGGHGARPENSIDPIVAAAAVIMGLQTAVSRETSPFEPVVVTIGSIHSGNAYNVIPQRAELHGTVRTFSPRVREQMPERVKRLVRQISGAYRCQSTVKYSLMTTALMNDEVCVSHVNLAVDQLIGKENRIAHTPTMASEDFAEYLQLVPGCFFYLGCGPQENAEQAFGVHHPEYNPDEQCIPLGAAIFSALVCERLGAAEDNKTDNSEW